MDCNNCRHMVSGMCEIYGDALPYSGNPCNDMDSLLAENSGFHMEDEDTPADLIGISIEEFMEFEDLMKGE